MADLPSSPTLGAAQAHERETSVIAQSTRISKSHVWAKPIIYLLLELGHTTKGHSAWSLPIRRVGCPPCECPWYSRDRVKTGAGYRAKGPNDAGSWTIDPWRSEVLQGR